MLRPTGPGKIRELVMPADTATSFAAVLFNYDIDGDTLKPQHRTWLAEHVIPQLADPQMRITLRGETSRSGDAAYNLALSRRRVQGVENFLRASPPVNANIATSGVGQADAEGRGEDAGTEDERVRAVIVKVEHSAHRFVPPVFNTSGNFQGFDPTANPPWLMLKAGDGPRIMQIQNAEGLTLVSSNPGAVRVQPALFTQDRPLRITQSSQLFRLFPGTTADAVIRAVDAAGHTHVSLGVSVLPQRIVRCAFHYVRNPRYGSRARNPGDEARFLERMNDVWGSQANIRFEIIGSGVRELPLTEDLGDRIDTTAKFERIGAHRFAAAQFNVFFVRNVQPQGAAADDDSDGVTDIGPPGDSLFEDPDDGGDDDPLVMAHESGHCLTLDHNDPIVTTDQMLMHHVVTRSFLPKAHVLQARRAVRR